MNSSKQLPLDLGSRNAYEREDFWVSPSNQDAVSWIDKWPNWPSSTLIILGPASSGKTHLLQVWRKTSSGAEIIPDKNIEISVESLAAEGVKNLILDGIGSIAGNLDKEKALFHIYNLTKERQGTLVISAEKPIKDYEFKLPDLKSRLLAATTATITTPDEYLITILLSKLFSDKQIFVPQDVISFLVPRVERSFKSVNELVDKLDYQSLSGKKPITIPLVKSILSK